jgi:transcriptional regulator with XRE-family HTH domain
MQANVGDGFGTVKAKQRRGRGPASRIDDRSELEVGGRLRHARLLNEYRLKDVAERAQVSESMLSRIENDLAMPSLSTLHRLCQALGLSISALLSHEQTRPWTIMRQHQRPTIGHKQAANGEGTAAEVLVPYVDGRLLEGFIIIIDPGGHSGGYLQHQGEEVGYIIEGKLELTIEDETYLLHAGDSFHFPSNLRHAYRNPGAVVMRAVWINTPPSF